MCPFKESTTIVVEDDATGDIQKVVGFILHGVAHALDDGIDVPKSHFVTFDNNVNIAVVDTHRLDSQELVDAALKETIAQVNGEMVAFVSGAWTLPDDQIEAQKNGTSGYATIKDHPSKIDIAVVTVEREDGVWLAKIPVQETNGKKHLPEVVTLEKQSDEQLNGEVPYPRVMVPTRAPADAVLH